MTQSNAFEKLDIPEISPVPFYVDIDAGVIIKANEYGDKKGLHCKLLGVELQIMSNQFMLIIREAEGILPYIELERNWEAIMLKQLVIENKSSEDTKVAYTCRAFNHLWQPVSYSKIPEYPIWGVNDIIIPASSYVGEGGFRENSMAGVASMFESTSMHEETVNRLRTFCGSEEVYRSLVKIIDHQIRQV